MKDESRAKWPDSGMKYQIIIKKKKGECFHRTLIASADKEPRYLGEMNDFDSLRVTEFRARQICALPDMVALLKRLSVLDSYSECIADAKAILKQIGEGE